MEHGRFLSRLFIPQSLSPDAEDVRKRIIFSLFAHSSYWQERKKKKSISFTLLCVCLRYGRLRSAAVSRGCTTLLQKSRHRDAPAVAPWTGLNLRSYVTKNNDGGDCRSLVFPGVQLFYHAVGIKSPRRHWRETKNRSKIIRANASEGTGVQYRRAIVVVREPAG